MQIYNLSSINNLGVENLGKPLHLLKIQYVENRSVTGLYFPTLTTP